MNKKAIAAFGGLAAFGILTASAASLGGLTSSSLGADQTVIASCDTDGVAMAYTNTYDATANAYKVSGVNISGVAAGCNGKSFRLTLSDGSVSLGEATGSISGTSQSIAVTPNIDAKSITKEALVITG
jgi:hypothetical protein